MRDISAASSGSSYVSVYRNKGDGTFAAPAEKLIPSAFVESEAIGDLDGDGRLDLAGSDGGGGVDVLLNTTP